MHRVSSGSSISKMSPSPSSNSLATMSQQVPPSKGPALPIRAKRIHIVTSIFSDNAETLYDTLTIIHDLGHIHAYDISSLTLRMINVVIVLMMMTV